MTSSEKCKAMKYPIMEHHGGEVMVTKLYDPRTSGAALTEPVSDWDQYLNMNICTAWSRMQGHVRRRNVWYKCGPSCRHCLRVAVHELNPQLTNYIPNLTCSTRDWCWPVPHDLLQVNPVRCKGGHPFGGSCAFGQSCNQVYRHRSLEIISMGFRNELASC